MHDIALSVMEKDCVTIVDRPNQKELLSAGPTRHMFSSYDLIGTLLDDYLKKHSPSLQTLLYPDSETKGSVPHLSKYNHLRALQLFPLEFFSLQRRHLQHLRYLDLSKNWFMKDLPKEITILYNLQTLNLSNCFLLGQLPKDMKYMTNLRHLYTNRCTSLKCMPPDLGQLTSLQTLTYFAVSSSPGCSTIGELRDINLSGELELSHLEYATEEHAKLSSLGNKQKLTHLSLEWSDDNSEELDQHRNVLDALKPHGVLEFLRIHSYKGTGFPTWVKSPTYLQHLTELHLNGCIMCEEFPQFGQFKALEVLVLKRLNKLRSLCGHSSSAAFPALRGLTLENLKILEKWVATEGEEITCPLLENVQIKNCPKLITLPKAAKPKVMNLAEYKARLSLSIFRSRYMSYLSELFVSVSDKEAIPTQKLDQDHEISISVMVLSGCDFLFSSSPLQPTVGVWKWFGQLVNLRIESCDMLICWPEEEFRSLVLLKIFSVDRCSKLIGPTKVKGYCSQGTDQLLPNLKRLGIYNCGSLTELFVLPPSLTNISIWSCDSLEYIPGQDDRVFESLQRFDTAASPELCNDLASTSMPEQSPSPRIHPLPCLESLNISDCKKLCFVSVQLNALLYLSITACSGLESLDCFGDLPLLQSLDLERCKHLKSVPGSLGNYSALQNLAIRYCPAINMKPLYGHLQQRLDSLEIKDISHACSSDPNEAGPKPNLWEPKSWKYAIPECH